MTMKEAARTALKCQDASNLSGILHDLDQIVSDVIWPAAHAEDRGSKWVARHPVVTMILLKMTELNGCCCGSLLPAYEVAEKACLELATGEGQDERLAAA